MRTKREIQPLLNKLSTPLKWDKPDIKADKCVVLDIKTISITSERIANVSMHNFLHLMYAISGTPMPDEFKAIKLYTNHTRTKIRRKRNGR